MATKMPVRRAVIANFLAYWRETGYPLLGITETPELFRSFCSHWDAFLPESDLGEDELIDPESMEISKELRPAFQQALVDLEAAGL